jgi:hypothetical protein
MCLFPTLQVRRCRTPSQGSRSGRFAAPFLCDSFIHHFTPVYPDAIVAVGTIITDRPPHGSVLALLTHTVLTLGVATKVRVV